MLRTVEWGEVWEKDGGEKKDKTKIQKDREDVDLCAYNPL